MVGGIISGPLIIAAANPDPKITQCEPLMCAAFPAHGHALQLSVKHDRVADLVGVCLLASGLGTIVHVIQINIWRTRYVFGTGIVSVMGITTTQVRIRAGAEAHAPQVA